MSTLRDDKRRLIQLVRAVTTALETGDVEQANEVWKSLPQRLQEEIEPKTKPQVGERDLLISIVQAAALALGELSHIASRRPYGMDNQPLEVRQAWMILRENLNNFDRKRLGMPPIPQELLGEIWSWGNR